MGYNTSVGTSCGVVDAMVNKGRYQRVMGVYQFSLSRDPGVFMALSGLAATLVPKHDSRPQPYNPQALKQRPVPEFKRQNEKLLYEELLIEELLI